MSEQKTADDSPYQPLDDRQDDKTSPRMPRWTNWMQIGISLAMVAATCIMLLTSRSSQAVRSAASSREKQLEQKSQTLQKENNSLRTEVWTLHEKILPSGQVNFGAIVVSQNSIQPDDGYFMLLRTSHAIGAIKLTNRKGEFFPERSDYAEFEWYFSADPTVTSFNDSESGTGEVYENYHPVGATQPDGGQRLEDAGSKTRIRFGTIDLHWSSGGWLYWRNWKMPNQPPYTFIQFAPTQATNIKDVRPQEAHMWYRSSPNLSIEDEATNPR